MTRADQPLDQRCETIGKGVRGRAGAAPRLRRHARRSRWSAPPAGWSCRSSSSRRSTAASTPGEVEVGAITDARPDRLGRGRRSPRCAQRTAVARLGRRSEEALYGLRVRLFEHIHRLSIADHGEERKGALVARVTSDVETLAQFFSWGALAWLLDGTLMLMVAGVMLAYDWVLALVAFVVAAPLALRAAQRAAPPRRGLRHGRERNAEVLTQISEVVSGAETLRAYDAGAHYAERDEAGQPRAVELVHPGRHHRRVPVPVRRGVRRAHRGGGRHRRV